MKKTYQFAIEKTADDGLGRIYFIGKFDQFPKGPKLEVLLNEKRAIRVSIYGTVTSLTPIREHFVLNPKEKDRAAAEMLRKQPTATLREIEPKKSVLKTAS